jgi:hypothetical protein
VIEEGYTAIGKTLNSSLSFDEAVQFFEKILKVHQNDDAMVSFGKCPFCGFQFAHKTGSQVILHIATWYLKLFYITRSWFENGFFGV